MMLNACLCLPIFNGMNLECSLIYAVKVLLCVIIIQSFYIANKLMMRYANHEVSVCTLLYC